jgi:hypothetical protein
MNQNDSEKNIETMLARLKQVQLTEEESATMRSRLQIYAHLHAAPSIGAEDSEEIKFPFFSPSHFISIRSSLYSYLSSYPRAVGGIALVLLVLVGTTGVTYASQDALPGDALYPVKVSLVEPIQGALITSPVAQANWQTELTSRRLSEAATLATEDKLSTSTQAYLADAVSEHVKNAEAEASKLSSSGNSNAAVQVRANLEANLTAHAEFLALITPQLAASGDATTTDAVFALLTHVQEARAEVDGTTTAPELPAFSAILAAESENLNGSAGGDVDADASSTSGMLDASSTIAIQALQSEDSTSTAEIVATLLADRSALLNLASSTATSTSNEEIRHILIAELRGSASSTSKHVAGSKQPPTLIEYLDDTGQRSKHS